MPAEAKETKDLERGSKKLTGYLKKPRCFWPFVSSTDEKEETQKVESTREVMVGHWVIEKPVRSNLFMH